LELLGDLPGAAHHVVPVFVPSLGDTGQDLPEARHSVARLVGEIGAGVERFAIGREKHRHRPAAATDHGVDGLHIDAVDVGALFAVDFHIDEVRVHLRRRGFVFERLVRHHVAPVTSGVADAE